MSTEEQNAIIGAQVTEYKEVKSQLIALVAKAEKMARGIRSIADTLSHEASIEEPTKVLHVGGKPSMEFVTEEEYRTLINDIKSNRSRLTHLESQLKKIGITMDTSI